MDPLTVEGKLDSLEAIAKYIMAAAAAAGLDKKAAYRLRLAVDEISTNIVVHGYEESGLEGAIDVYADIDETTLTITLEDAGIAYDPNTKPPQDDLDTPIDERQVGGLGVYLAFQNVDKFLYERTDGCNRNIFVVNRPVVT